MLDRRDLREVMMRTALGRGARDVVERPAQAVSAIGRARS
jgi:hypothetical protein